MISTSPSHMKHHALVSRATIVAFDVILDPDIAMAPHGFDMA